MSVHKPMRDERGWSERVRDAVIFDKMYRGSENRLLSSITLFMGESNQMHMI